MRRKAQSSPNVLAQDLEIQIQNSSSFEGEDQSVDLSQIEEEELVSDEDEEKEANLNNSKNAVFEQNLSTLTDELVSHNSSYS